MLMLQVTSLLMNVGDQSHTLISMDAGRECPHKLRVPNQTMLEELAHRFLVRSAYVAVQWSHARPTRG